MKKLTSKHIAAYGAHLCREDRAPATIEKYLQAVSAFAAWLGDRPVAKELAAAWREHLLASGLTPATVNGKLAALNGLFKFLGWDECRVKFLRVQRSVFRDAAKELTRSEYERLRAAAERMGRDRLALLMEGICAAGIRVSEVKYLTVEAAARGRADIRLKGKLRSILLPGKLCRKLLKYAKRRGITGGAIFRGRGSAPLSRKAIWREMKSLCAEAGVEPSKVFPHNLRRLFAVTFYKVCRDIVKLADVLGHSSVETTRVYLTTPGREHAALLERLRLVS